MREINVANLQRAVPAVAARARRAVHYALRQEGVEAFALSVALVDDRRMRELNRRFLGRDEPTDVLSFDLGEDGPALCGEIVANAERAAAVARGRHADPAGELLLYVVHGLLHLLGYDDQAPREARRMRRRQDQILAGLGFPGAYAAGRLS